MNAGTEADDEGQDVHPEQQYVAEPFRISEWVPKSEETVKAATNQLISPWQFAI